MTIEDSFNISGRGAVAVGQIESGFFYVGQKAVVVTNNGEYVVTIVGVEAFRKMMNYAGPGEKVGLSIDGIDRETLETGYELRGLPSSMKKRRRSAARDRGVVLCLSVRRVSDYNMRQSSDLSPKT